MNVAVFVDKPVPEERPTGIGVSAFNLAAALSRRKVNVQFVCRGTVNGVRKINDFMTIHAVRNFSRDNLLVALSLVRRESPEVVHVHSSAALPSLILGRMLGRGVVVHAHSDEPLHPLRLGLMRKAGMDLSHLVLAVSEDTRTSIIKRQHVPPSKVKVVYNGVDTLGFRQTERSLSMLLKYGLADFGKIILSVGAVQARKGQWRIIQSLPEILSRWPDTVYVNIGRAYDEAYEMLLLKEAARLGVAGNVKFLVDIPQADLVMLINSSQVCVHPSSGEGFGLAVVEEMACARPVVAFRLSVLSEIVDDGVDGVLVEPGDSEGLTGSIIRLLDDDSLAREIGRAARQKVVNKFTWDAAAAQTEAIFHELLSGRKE